MSNIVEKYRQRRQNRLDEKNNVEVDVDKVQAYRDRRDARVKDKVDGGPGSGKPKGYGGAKAAGTFQKKSKSNSSSIQSGFAGSSFDASKSSLTSKGYQEKSNYEAEKYRKSEYQVGDKEKAKQEVSSMKADFERQGYTLKELNGGFKAYKNKEDAENDSNMRSRGNKSYESIEVTPSWNGNIEVRENYGGETVDVPVKANLTEKEKATFDKKYEGKSNSELEKAYQDIMASADRKNRYYHNHGGNVEKLNKFMEQANQETAYIGEKLGYTTREFVRS